MNKWRKQRTAGGNRTMVAAATIISLAAADGERISIFPLVCPNKALIFCAGYIVCQKKEAL